MASLAIPGSNSFAGEFLILTGVFRQHVWLAVLACLGIAYAAVYMLRLYQSTMNGPVHGGRGADAELRGRDLAVILPLVAVMLVIALWPRGIVDATTPSVERALGAAQIAADRPDDQIGYRPTANPPPEALPLPGDVDTTASPVPEEAP